MCCVIPNAIDPGQSELDRQSEILYVANDSKTKLTRTVWLSGRLIPRICILRVQVTLCKDGFYWKYSNSAPLSFTSMSTNKGEGRREDILLKQRNQMREEYERQKQSLINETEKARPSANRFVGQNDSMEEHLKNNTIGLVRLEDFQKKKKELEEAKARAAARSNDLKYVSFLIFLLLFSVH